MHEPTLASLDQVELTTTFQLGTVPVTLDALKAIRPGYTFTTTIDSDAPTVAIIVEGQRVGAGRLVAVGEQIGVQVTHWTTSLSALSDA